VMACRIDRRQQRSRRSRIGRHLRTLAARDPSDLFR
jgi:hypothetical protein